MTRRERRNNDPEIQKKREQFSSVLAGPLSMIPSNSGGSGGGWGNGQQNGKLAQGQSPSANPFIIPKSAGLNVFSQTFPSNYFVEFNLSSWRSASDKVTLQGYTMDWATLSTWTYECSPFVQSLFEALGSHLKEYQFIS